MSHVIELPDEAYRAIARYAEQRGETPEAAIVAWAESIAAQASVPDMSGYVYNPAEDPLAAFLGTGELTSPDAIRRHDDVFGSKESDASAE